MARIISQDTFNEVVKENILEFDMTPEDAVKEAVKQFEAQGVDLSNIVKDVVNTLSTASTFQLKQALEKVSALQKDTSAEETLVDALDELTFQCNKSLAHKVFAGKNRCYDILLNNLEGADPNINVLVSAAKSLASLMTGQPDLLDARGINAMFKNLADTVPSLVHAEVLDWATQCCIKHERNRQDLMKRGISLHLKRLLQSDVVLSPTIRSACRLIQALVLDDDVRVEFGLAHEHAKELASEVLCTLVDLAKRFEDRDILNELLMTMSALIVRNEFCTMFRDVGGLQLIIEAMEKQLADKVLIQQCLKLIKVLAGNDDVKAAVMSAGIAPFIVSALNQHRSVAAVVSQGCATIAAVTLRSPANSKLFVEHDVADAILEGMKMHPKSLSVQKQGSWAIRNIVSRDRALCAAFLQRNAEDVLKEALKKHGAVYEHEYDIKSALRDLGCDVKLREMWTGKGGALN